MENIEIKISGEIKHFKYANPGKLPKYVVCDYNTSLEIKKSSYYIPSYENANPGTLDTFKGLVLAIVFGSGETLLEVVG